MSRRKFLTALLLAAANQLVAQQPAYRDTALPIEPRVRDLLGRMTLDEKFWQLFMIPGDLDDSTHHYDNGVFGLQVRMEAGPAATARAHAEKINAIQRFFVEKTRLGIPMLAFEETVHGLLASNATVFPAAIALAATWDTALAGRVGTAIAREASSRGIRQGLSPVVNIATDPRWGRTEETYGEDPLLTARMSAAFVRGFEKNGVIATPKHFVANVGEGGRDSYPIDVSRRTLEEIHFPPFISAIQEGGARSVMTAYNSVDGSPATQNRELLNNTLKRDWRFGGFVISDQAATGGATVLHHTEATTATAAKDALDAGLDVIFQSSWREHLPYLAAFRSGTISDSVIDAAVARVLRAKFELGLFERPYANPDSAAYWNDRPSHRALARDVARASIVLLRNEQHVLPLPPWIQSIALIGEDAAEPRFGGYSGVPAQAVSIAEGIQRRAGRGTVIRYARGPGRLSLEFVKVPAAQLSSMDSGRTVQGLRGEYFDNPSLSGQPKLIRTDPGIDFGWTFNSPGRDIPVDWFSIRWTGRITAPRTGVPRLGIEGNDGYRLYIDGRLFLDNWKKQSFRVSLAQVRFAAGSTHDIRIEYFQTTGNTKIKLVWDAGVDKDWRAKIDTAAAIARRSSVAIVVAGIEEGEFRDRAKLSLPGHQEELIERVAATGTQTVVVLIGGSAVTGGKWIDRVSGLIAAWYPGEEGGSAIADVLFGDYNPAGRLPMTWPVFEGQLPLVYNHKPTGRGDDYVDLTGEPLFPFGFGLSYTTFDYSGLTLSGRSITRNDSVTLRFKVRNTGSRTGDEVVQLYVKDLLASVARPVMRLEGFQRVTLRPGEEKEISFTIGPESLRMLDRDMRWVVEPGTFRALIGSSSKHIRLRSDFQVRGDVPPLIPLPKSFAYTEGQWSPDQRLVTLIADPATASHDELRKHGVAISFEPGTPESYRLDVNHAGVMISAADSAGLFYGLQTLRELVEAGTPVRGIHIVDAPRFPYRGMHLDVARHFEPAQFVKRYIDLLSRYKLNTFHWHLTDDQGWRIEIAKYPRLTRVGGCRRETMLAQNFNPYIGDHTPHCGFYTKDDVRDVVAYAKRRNVTVIPEIEMPGHVKAALAAYPELACTPGPFEVRTTWGVDDDILCPSEKTFRFIDDVLTEVAALFPGQYIHIGGDEVPKKRWQESPVAQEVMRRENLSNPEALQSWFIRRVEEIVIAKGKRMIGWDEILEGGIAPEATVMSWRGSSGGIAAAKENHEVIMSPNSHLYFDAYQGDAKQEPLAIGGFLPLERVYGFEPVPDSLSAEQARHILGAQANVWTEYITTPAAVEYMAYPRALALAEVVWSPKEVRSWPSFQERLPHALRSLDRQRVRYRLPDIDGLDGDRLTLANSVTVRLSTTVPDGVIRYTIDGTEPARTSTAYRVPITVNATEAGVRVQARAFAPDGRATAIRSATFRRTSLSPATEIDSAKLSRGLNYSYHEVLAQFVATLDTARVARNAVVNAIQRRGDERPEQYGLRFTGLLRVPDDGVYEFALMSDDGSTLVIDGRMVVDNDDYHGAQEKRGMIAMARGLHPVVIRYAQAGGGAELSLSVRREGGEWMSVPAEWLAHHR